jgi:proteasome lid subunit RPN8/RPN11
VLLLPEDVLRSERRARELKLDVIGYYHSHPNAAAIPSQYDLEHALPVWSYVIVSVINGKATDIRSWEMEEDRTRFNEETIETSEGRSIWQSQ